MPVTKSGTDLSLVFAEGIGLHSVPAHHRAAYVKPQFASPEAARHVMQERLYLLLVKIHQHTLHDEDKFPVGMFAAQVVHPAGFQQGRSDIDIARLFGYQFPAQGDDLRQIQIVKDRFPVPDSRNTIRAPRIPLRSALPRRIGSNRIPDCPPAVPLPCHTGWDCPGGFLLPSCIAE